MLGGPAHGIVTGFHGRGMFVSLPEHGVSGSMTFREMDGFWDVDDRQVAATEKKTGQVLALGSPVRVRVTDLDPFAGEVTMSRAKKSTRRGGR